MRHSLARSSCLVVAAALLLAGCDVKEGTGDRDSSPHVPAVATPVPPATSDPELTKRDLGFTGNDTDGDGRVTSSEYAAAAQRFFAAVDTGNNGTLDLQEMESAGKAIGISDASLAGKTILEADNDGDGQLTLAEFIASVNNRFGRIDTNRDGWLSQEEFSRGFAEVPAAANTPQAQPPMKSAPVSPEK